MTKAIVYTRHGGGVSICYPAIECMRWMTHGGGYWSGRPRGFLQTQIERQVAAGHHADAAVRFVQAMQFGGLTDAEAYAVIRDRDCAHLGTGCELWDAKDIPVDRTYRDAWRRSHNGGPIWIDELKALEIDEARAWATYEVQRWR
jgi:hypothetical protein